MNIELIAELTERILKYTNSIDLARQKIESLKKKPIKIYCDGEYVDHQSLWGGDVKEILISNLNEFVADGHRDIAALIKEIHKETEK